VVKAILTYSEEWVGLSAPSSALDFLANTLHGALPHAGISRAFSGVRILPPMAYLESITYTLECVDTL
jgi:hypothetical protein